MSGDENGRPSIDEILAAEAESGDQNEGPYAQYPLVTPHRIALLHLGDCAEQLERSDDDPIRLAQAAKSIHLALQAALIAALAGSMGIGAYGKKLELQWLDYLQGDGKQPRHTRVMEFDGLLTKATSQTLEWHQRSLEVTDEERELLTRLTYLRDRIEHPRPCFWLIEPAYIHAVLPLAARLTFDLLSGLRHQFEPGEIEDAKLTVEKIARLSAA